MGTLGDEGEFNRLLCSCWLVAGLWRLVIGLLIRRAAAGVWGERLGANTAVALHSGQQVELRLRGLPTGDSNTLVQPNRNIKRQRYYY